MAKEYPAGTVLGPDGSPVSSERVRADKRNRFNPCRGLTPRVLSAALEAAQRGNISRLAWIQDWIMEHDDTVSSVSAKARGAVARHGWDIVVDSEIPDGMAEAAAKQEAALRGFYGSLVVGNAVDPDEEGGIRLLAEQMVDDGYGKGASAHHLVWRPSPEGIRAKAVFVPLRFFESMDGPLKFLPTEGAYEGVPLDDGKMGGRAAWMISRGRGVMKACAVAWMFKNMPLQDWVTYSERHGMPGFLGKSGAVPGSADWNAMVAAVRSMSAEWSAVVGLQEVIDVIDMTAGGEIPYPKLIDRMDRAITILWRGGDLGTMSQKEGVGADAQADETDEMDADTAGWISETVDRQVSRRVIDYTFGTGAPHMAHFIIKTAVREDKTRKLALVQGAVAMGVRVPVKWFCQTFEVPLAEEGEEVLGAPAGKPGPGAGGAAAVANAGGGNARATVLQTALAAALGVRSEMLAPVAAELETLAEASGEGGLDDAAFLDLWEMGVGRLPEFFDPARAGEVASELEAAMGAGAMAGAREGFK
jgi:phage gp29-like protein